MAADNQGQTPDASRLLSCYLHPETDGLVSSAVMLCEMIGDEIQSISLRVAADSMARSLQPGSGFRPEQG